MPNNPPPNETPQRDADHAADAEDVLRPMGGEFVTECVEDVAALLAHARLSMCAHGHAADRSLAEDIAVSRISVRLEDIERIMRGYSVLTALLLDEERIAKRDGVAYIIDLVARVRLALTRIRAGEPK